MDTADPHIRQQSLRRLGGLAHQARASLRAADRFSTEGSPVDRDTASWLVCTAMELAREISDDFDVLAKGLRETGSDATRQQSLAPWRRLAHQLHAASRAADLYLEQESRGERDTGTWLIASALGLADRLTSALDDGVGAWAATDPVKRVTPPMVRAAPG